MKKIILMTLLIIIIVSSSGCGESVQSSADPENTPYELKERYYEVYEVTKYGRPLYQYFVFSSNHLAFDKGIVYGFPHVSKSGSIIKICVQIDEGVVSCRYFDTESKLSSIWFISPVAENDTLVAYPDQPWEATKLIVQDIFDKSEYYKEFERDFDEEERPIDYAEFANDGNQLIIKYITKKDKYYETVTETLDLN